ncbi:MAG: enoyl-CoA hydratase-related protein [Pseudomonadota bacterium]|jgi:enoyl-CoA hydratase/carnithine racemase|nr:enoyl-CoA hydratase-related protein [Pseudomonadota bacterium]
MFEFVGVEKRGATTVICLQRPRAHNALHPPAVAEIGHALDLFEADPDARVAIITGSGDQAFCAGFDLKYAEAHPQLYTEPMFGSEIVRRRNRSKPLIAAVNGLALGFGFELALSCDLIVASPSARFALPEARVGLAAMAGGVARLTRELGPKAALGIVLTGRMVAAEEGLRLGFVNEVAHDSALEAALRWAEQIGAGAPLSLAASLEMAYATLDDPQQAAALDPRTYPSVMRVLGSEDAAEGRRAFIEKRAPVWKAR